MNFSREKIIAWFNHAANWLPLIQWLSWTLVAYLCARIFWIWFLVFSSPQEMGVVKFTSQAQTQTRSSSALNISELLNLNLFGSEADKTVKPVVQLDAPVTRLKLKLRGIYAAEDKTKANAIIEDGRGKQAVYFIGEKLTVSGRVYLRQVYVDRVIIETNGKNETLKLETRKQLDSVIKTPRQQGKKNSNKRVEDKRNNKRVSRQLKNYRKELLEDPMNLRELIRPQPHFIDGKLQGFKISPGKDKRLFQLLGLKRGDIVTSVNGIALTNVQQAMGLMNQVESVEELNVDINRNGETINLLLNLNDKSGQ